MKLSTRLRTAAAGGAVLLAGAIAASPASATGAYPGETLSLAQSTPATVGQATTIVAGGQQADVNDYAGGFDLEVFQKDPARDPTCAADYEGEKNTYGTELPAEKWIVIGQWQGMGTTFSVPFKASFDKPGPWLLCAYSTWTVDTAAVAQLTVDATGGSPGSPGSSPTPAKPVNLSKPRVKRAGRRLTCRPGTWSNQPSRFAYRWRVGSRVKRGAHGRRLSVTRRLRGRSVRCTVTAANAAGSAKATSRPFRVR